MLAAGGAINFAGGRFLRGQEAGQPDPDQGQRHDAARAVAGVGQLRRHRSADQAPERRQVGVQAGKDVPARDRVVVEPPKSSPLMTASRLPVQMPTRSWGRGMSGTVQRGGLVCHAHLLCPPCIRFGGAARRRALTRRHRMIVLVVARPRDAAQTGTTTPKPADGGSVATRQSHDPVPSLAIGPRLDRPGAVADGVYPDVVGGHDSHDPARVLTCSGEAGLPYACRPTVPSPPLPSMLHTAIAMVLSPSGRRIPAGIG